VKAGVPPKIPAVNFGAFQQIINSSTDDAAISSASTAGSGPDGTAVAAAAHPLVNVSPAPISKYSTITFTPVETASEI
jgi:hypothetical protein